MAKYTNKLNDLTNREWLMETKSFWWTRAGADPDRVGANSPDAPPGWALDDVADLAAWLRETRGDERAQDMLGQLFPSYMTSIAPPRDKRKLLHPATFSERDVERLIRFFTKAGETVMDPFLGSGSTLVACRDSGRVGTGVELIEQWAQIARERLAQSGTPDTPVGRMAQEAGQECPAYLTPGQTVIQGDALATLGTVPGASFDFIVTSPPYWSILDKRGMKVEAERTSKDLPTKYSEDQSDLGNVTDYDEFLDRLAAIFRECGRVLKPKRYMAVIVSDFRHGPHFVLFHADLARRIEQVGVPLKGITILLQDSKNLYPFGVPNAFVSNVHHQYILIHQKV
ncbi:site-specific DNA-methyltransferase [bacterium]|nr:site-specific DNA-methyltransferase [bacterium]